LSDQSETKPAADAVPVERWVGRPVLERASFLSLYGGDMPASADERHLRRLLALRVAMPHTYYDDGEASGHEQGISIDFMREPVADIDAKLRALNVARAEVIAANQRRWNSFDPSKASSDGGT